MQSRAEAATHVRRLRSAQPGAAGSAVLTIPGPAHWQGGPWRLPFHLSESITDSLRRSAQAGPAGPPCSPSPAPPKSAQSLHSLPDGCHSESIADDSPARWSDLVPLRLPSPAPPKSAVILHRADVFPSL